MCKSSLFLYILDSTLWLALIGTFLMVLTLNTLFYLCWPLHFFFWEMLIQVISPFLNWISCLELLFLTYSDCQSFIREVACKHWFPTLSKYFHSINYYLFSTYGFEFYKNLFSWFWVFWVFFFWRGCKYHFLYQCLELFPLFLSSNFKVLGLTFRCLIHLELIF